MQSKWNFKPKQSFDFANSIPKPQMCSVWINVTLGLMVEIVHFQSLHSEVKKPQKLIISCLGIIRWDHVYTFIQKNPIVSKWMGPKCPAVYLDTPLTIFDQRPRLNCPTMSEIATGLHCSLWSKWSLNEISKNSNKLLTLNSPLLFSASSVIWWSCFFTVLLYGERSLGTKELNILVTD